MPITYPRDMPCPTPGAVTFAPMRHVARAVSGYSVPQVAELAPMQWRGLWSFQVREAQFAEWAAWLASLRGGLKTFKGRPRRKWPRAYPRGFGGMTKATGGAFGGSGVVSTISPTRDDVTLTGLPSLFVLQPNDYFSVPAGTRQHLHRVIAGGTASAGGLLTVTCEPPLRPNVVVGAPALLDAPWCDMVLAAEPSESSGPGGGSISFEGLQVLA